jgi:hypothetical protein
MINTRVAINQVTRPLRPALWSSPQMTLSWFGWCASQQEVRNGGQASLDQAIGEYVAHYHDERTHQGIRNEIVSGAMPQQIGPVEVRARLGGLLNCYHQRAA